MQSCSIPTAVVTPPPANFNFKNEILDVSTPAIAESHPELLDLARNGTLVVIKKSQNGRVPTWRNEFVEQEAIWIVGTTHVSQESASDVEMVISAVRPDNVVVELCRSRWYTGKFLLSDIETEDSYRWFQWCLEALMPIENL